MYMYYSYWLKICFSCVLNFVQFYFLLCLIQHWQPSGQPMIGCFCAASNITGNLVDVNSITICLHKHGAFAFWDYATAAPYVKIDMNPVVTRYGLVFHNFISFQLLNRWTKLKQMKKFPVLSVNVRSNDLIKIIQYANMKMNNMKNRNPHLRWSFVDSSEEQPYVYKDAVFMSAHKFVGGVQTPGRCMYRYLYSVFCDSFIYTILVLGTCASCKVLLFCVRYMYH